jgi:hypothetical protein
MVSQSSSRLKLLALGEDGDGSPAELHLPSAVEYVQGKEAVVILENGEKHTCDLIVASDGVSGVYNSILELHAKLTVLAHASENKCLIQPSQNQQEKLLTDS